MSQLVNLKFLLLLLSLATKATKTATPTTSFSKKFVQRCSSSSSGNGITEKLAKLFVRLWRLDANFRMMPPTPRLKLAERITVSIYQQTESFGRPVWRRRRPTSSFISMLLQVAVAVLDANSISLIDLAAVAAAAVARARLV